MKRLLCLILPLCLALAGCELAGERIKEPVTFYYLRAEYSYGTGESVIVSEDREASGHRSDLSYLLALYLVGPSAETLVSPLPQGTRILSVARTETEIQLELSDLTDVLTDAEFSLACACLTLTCLELTGATQVSITSGARAITMSKDSLALIDSSVTAATEETQ